MHDNSAFSIFTFQYGEIKSCQIRRTICARKNLHSSMERLKAPVVTSTSHAILNLHSSMERLKAYVLPVSGFALLQFTFQYGEIKSWKSVLILMRVNLIYIPVWRD